MSDGSSGGEGDNEASGLLISRRNILKYTGTSAISSTAYTATASAQTGPTVNIRQINRPDFPEVTVFATVQDSSGSSVTNLTKSDFTLTETRLGTSSTQAIDTLLQPAEEIAGNIATSIVIDQSGSMSTGTRMQDAIEGGKEFVQQFGSEDEGLLVAFDDAINTPQRWTNIQSDLTSAIDTLSPDGSTALFDAVKEGLNEADPRTDRSSIGRSAVVVLADGQDNASTASATEVINAANQQNIPIYTIGLGNTINATNLERLASETGGEYYRSVDGSDLAEVYNEISDSIAGEYQISYITNDNTTDGEQREIRLETNYNGETPFDTETYEEPCAPLPTASFDLSPDAAVETQEVSFDGTGSQPNGGTLVSYEWDFNNDGSIDATGETATNTFTQAGQYDIALTVEKTCGARDVEVKSLAVADEPVSVVKIDTNDPIQAGDVLEVDIELRNAEFDKENRTVALQDFNGNTVAAEPVQVGRGETLNITLEWDTEIGDGGTDDITVLLSDISVTEEVEIQRNPAGKKLQTARLIDQQSSLSRLENYANTTLEGDEELTQSTISALEQAVSDGRISEETKQSAIRRLQAVENVSLQTIQRIGPATPENNSTEVNISENTAINTIKTAVNLLAVVAGISISTAGLGPLATAAATAVSGTLNDFATDTINDLVGAGEDENENDLAQEAINRCKQRTAGLGSDIQDGAVSGPQSIVAEIEQISEEIIDLVQDSIRTTVEIDAIHGVFSALPPGTGIVRLLGTGNSIYGTLSDVDSAFEPNDLANSGLQGSTETAVQTLAEIQNDLDSTIRATSNLIDDLEAVSGELNIWESIEDLLNGNGSVIWGVIELAYNLLASAKDFILDILTSAGATLVGYDLLVYIKIMQSRIETAAIEGREVTLPDV